MNRAPVASYVGEVILEIGRWVQWPSASSSTRIRLIRAPHSCAARNGSFNNADAVLLHIRKTKFRRAPLGSEHGPVDR